MVKARTPLKTPKKASRSPPRPSATTPQASDVPLTHTSRSGRKVKVQMASFQGTEGKTTQFYALGVHGGVYSGKKTVLHAPKSALR
mmetsp:Transcript_21284/g.47287  ORF Transcript_21284/g.47287 Transcript_21284/m.47287 type:complete len:86 (-) Transcript_21284:289-546(-)